MKNTFALNRVFSSPNRVFSSPNPFSSPKSFLVFSVHRRCSLPDILPSCSHPSLPQIVLSSQVSSLKSSSRFLEKSCRTSPNLAIFVASTVIAVAVQGWCKLDL
ncbi:hypothetical protein OIU77_008978 [Salix suchowensis]|uniref:Uncharacterized protein n=1 Tax=Salix suchowensis TaxID=1278906 RepID=A0ABQ9ACS9_9ROSI|nr:hypothetical protein OIU77_008978 [Salix suchowensis]